MPILIPETGAIVVGANTYATMAFADSYHEQHNNTKWAAAEDEPKISGLLYATRWIDAAPVEWQGARASRHPDTLNWPRLSAYDHDGVLYTGVPTRLQRAVCELALAHLTKILNEILARGGELSSVWVGPITVSWNDWAQADRKYPMVKRLLKGLYRGGSGMGRRIVRG